MRSVETRAILAVALFGVAFACTVPASAAEVAVSADAVVEPQPAKSPAPVAEAPTAKGPARTLGDLQSPQQVSTRYSAYTLPAHYWSIDVGALGVGDGDAFLKLAFAYGLGGGVELNANLAHIGVGLLNLSAGWHFIDTRYFDLGARFGVWYGHGAWFWIADGLSSKVLSNIDAVKVPLLLTASSMPTRWLELDLGVQYTYAKIYGSSAQEVSIFSKSELGMQQFFLRPGVRLFISDRVALELFAKLPVYSWLPIDDRKPSVPFKYTWGMEGGLRSRLARGLFGTVRLNYASISDVLYGARLYPSFEIEIRP